ncbi:MAG: flagellar motor protein MotB [Acidobacteria bacterium]|nr:MAG: flagellar motor protein MotB [Acidobacteriota bacterium]
MRKLKMVLAMVSLLIAVMPAGAAQIQQRGKQPIYTITINVVDRTTKAINYQHRNGSTTIDFRGTPLMPAARGEAKVESKQGYMEVEVEFDNLQSATRFGPEFLTYVMWTITPEGRAANMGEVILNGTKSKLDVTTELQAFGLVVTAEPYFGVTQPSDVVVLENFVRKDTVGKVEEIDAKYELLQRGQYTVNVLPADLKPIQLDKNTPLDLYEARNAVRIAKWAGADVSAADSFEKASKLLAQAEAYKARKAGSKPIAMTAREAVQTAEDARLITLKTQAEARLAEERAASAGREATANAAADRARGDANDAERERAAAQAQAERTKLDAQLAAQRAAAEAKAQAERTKMEAELAAQRAAREKEAVEAANQLARKTAAEQSEREKQELRNKLVLQLNTILQTRDSARGLIVNMSDVLFDTGQYSLRPAAREKLAKISGIVLAYPTLKLEVEGHTDSVGTDQLNMLLSENRANSVRDFLVNQGIVTSSITSRGFGKAQPVATNDTSAGRQQNRRVELVVSGDVIGGSGGPAIEGNAQR